MSSSLSIKEARILTPRGVPGVSATPAHGADAQHTPGVAREPYTAGDEGQIASSWGSGQAYSVRAREPLVSVVERRELRARAEVRG